MTTFRDLTCSSQQCSSIFLHLKQIFLSIYAMLLLQLGVSNGGGQRTVFVTVMCTVWDRWATVPRQQFPISPSSLQSLVLLFIFMLMLSSVKYCQYHHNNAGVLNNYIKPATHTSARRHPHQYFLHQSNTDHHRRSFFIRTAKQWNALPPDSLLLNPPSVQLQLLTIIEIYVIWTWND